MQEFINHIVMVVVYFGAAWLLSRFVPGFVASTAISSAQARRRYQLSDRRIRTIERLSTDLTRGILFLIATVLSLALFVPTGGLFTFLGLFSAGFGLGARPIVSDYISGIIYLFEDQYSIGDKVEVFDIEGTVEDIHLRATKLRAPSGEVYFVPNGEIRVVRNFARGKFSLATIHVRLQTEKLGSAIHLLESMAPQMSIQIPDLLETPQIYSDDGLIGDRVDLTVYAKARYGQGAHARRKLLEMVRQRFAEEGLEIHS